MASARKSLRALAQQRALPIGAPAAPKQPNGAFCLGIALALAPAMAGCSDRPRGPELLTLIDVVPAEVLPGDQLEVVGIQLPSGDAASARIVFRGTARKPGREAIEGVVVVVDAASVSRDRVSIAASDEIIERFVGRGDEATHTTFTGSVEVEIPTVTGIAVHGALKQEVRLDFVPRPPRQALADAKAKDAERALEWLGIEGAPASGSGVVVGRVLPGGVAERAGLAAGDRIERLDGLTVLDATDLIPRPAARAPLLGYRRGSSTFDVAVSTGGHRGGALRDLVAAFAVLGTLALVFGARSLGFMRFASWAELRLLGQASPRAARLTAARSFITEAVSAVIRDDADPAASGGFVAIAPYLVFLCVSLALGALPFACAMGSSQLDVATPLLASATGVSLVALATAGWSADRAWSLGIALRACFRAASTTLPALIAATCVVLRGGSVRVSEILAGQTTAQGSGFEIGGWPWCWNAARNPLVFLVFCLAFTMTLVESDAAAESPLGAGNGRGLRPVLFFLAEWTHVFVLAALGALLFLGGWLLPGIGADRQGASVALSAIGAAAYLLKAWALLAMVVLGRWTFPRIREGMVARMVWTRFVPLGAVMLGLAVAWDRLRPDATLELGVAALVLSTASVAAAVLGVRFLRNLRAARPRLHLHPFL